jgi:hypothetical protein
MIKNTREENVVAREERNFIFFTRFARRIKSRRRDRNWSSDFLVQLFLPKKKRETKKRQNFFQNKSFILSFSSSSHHY